MMAVAAINPVIVCTWGMAEPMIKAKSRTRQNEI
jgi:hypothetical protein